MTWSFRIGKWFGIDVFVHFTFVLLLGFIGLSHWMQTRELGGALAGVGFFVALFACVLLHEFGHALTARKFGIKTRDMTLLPIGGLARLERMPDKPMQEFWVALAGPAVNVVIAGGLLAYLIATSALVPVEQLSVTGGSFLARLAAVNVFLVAFNMLPAFPMDGGRVLRALLATRMDYARAVQHILAGFQQDFPVVERDGRLVGVLTRADLIRALSEAGQTGLVGEVMQREFHTASPLDMAEGILARLQECNCHSLPVVQSDRLVGLLTAENLGEFLMIQGAPGKARSAKGSTGTA